MTSDLALISQAMSQLQLEARTLRSQLADLDEQGVAHAKSFLETDRRTGRKNVMRLAHWPDSPTAPATRQRREYVGLSPLKQTLARERMARWPEYSRLQGQLRQVEGRLTEMNLALTQLTRLATGCATLTAPSQLLAQAQQLYQQGRLAEVIRVLELLKQETTPETSPVLLGQAALLQSRVYTAWGHYATSLAALNTALPHLSGQPEALLILHLCWAYTLWLDRQLGAAGQHLQRALVLLPPLYVQSSWPPAGLVETVLETYPVLLHTWQNYLFYPLLPRLSQLLQLYPSPGRPALQFYCLGRPTLWVKNEAHHFDPTRHSPNYPALLAYLFHHPRGCPWSELALALWPDSPAKTASNRLHQTLKRLRHKPLGDPTYLHSPTNSYGLNPAYPTWSDGPLFDHLLQQLPHPPTAKNLPRYLDVLHLYQGKFLAGFTLTEWGRQQRHYYENRFLQISHLVAHFLLQQGRFWEALGIIKRGLKQDYYREGLHRLALHAYAHIGLYNELGRHYEYLCQQLGHPPEPKTEQLYQRLRRLYNRETRIRQQRLGPK